MLVHWGLARKKGTVVMTRVGGPAIAIHVRSSFFSTTRRAHVSRVDRVVASSCGEQRSRLRDHASARKGLPRSWITTTAHFAPLAREYPFFVVAPREEWCIVRRCIGCLHGSEFSHSCTRVDVRRALGQRRTVLSGLTGSEKCFISGACCRIISNRSVTTQPRVRGLLSRMDTNVCTNILMISLRHLTENGNTSRNCVDRIFRFSKAGVVAPVGVCSPTGRCSRRCFRFNLFVDHQRCGAVGHHLVENHSDSTSRKG